MKKILLVISLLLLEIVRGQDFLSQKIVELDKAYNNKELQALANDFERIALAEKNNSLAQYYTAYTYVRIADQAKENLIDSYCDKAEEYLKKAISLGFDSSETNALYAYLYSAKVKVSPMFRGSKMGKISKEYGQKAIKENPANPRPYLIRAIGVYYTPKVFGGGKEKALPILEEASEKFKNFVPKTPQYPHWGQGMLNYLLEEAKK